MLRSLAVLLLALAAAPSARAQADPRPDRVVTWQTYAAQRSARVRVFETDDERRPTTFVIDDRAVGAAPATEDATFLADLLAREHGVDPVAATFVFRFTPAAFSAGGADAGKTLLLRATFSRTSSGALASPQWRVLTSDALEDLTDRAMR